MVLDTSQVEKLVVIRFFYSSDINVKNETCLIKYVGLNVSESLHNYKFRFLSIKHNQSMIIVLKCKLLRL